MELTKLNLGLIAQALDAYWRQTTKELERRNLGTLERRELLELEAALKEEIAKFQGL